MSVLRRFNEAFGLEDNEEDERRRFVQRVNQFIFHLVDTERTDQYAYRVLFGLICFELGVNAHDYPDRKLGMSIHEWYLPASIRSLTGDDFAKTLRVLCILYCHIRSHNDKEEGRKWLSENIDLVLSRCTCDIGVRWKAGFFYPAGAKELDEPLIEQTLTWLNDYREEQTDYRQAIEYYLERGSLPDVIKNCYSAVEGIARKVIGNQKTLDNNKDELLKRIGLSDGWKALLANYINYAHDYRHASLERHRITTQEAEAFLYMTDLIIRLIIES